MDICKELNPNPNFTLSPPITPIPKVSEENRLFGKKQEKLLMAALAVPTGMLGDPAADDLDFLFASSYIGDVRPGARFRLMAAFLLRGICKLDPFLGMLMLLLVRDMHIHIKLWGKLATVYNQCFQNSSLAGVDKIWSMPEVKILSSLNRHPLRATNITFSPTNNHVASASSDRTARLWNTKETLLNTYKGHLDRLARVAFHPSGKHLGTAGFDKTWRLWDTETSEELRCHEGHAQSVYGLDFHPDGLRAASCGLDALAHVWDLQSGKSIVALEGHVKPVLGISFSPNEYHLATGGEDNTCIIWDLRKNRSLYTIPAHEKLISQIKFEPQEGYFW